MFFFKNKNVFMPVVKSTIYSKGKKGINLYLDLIFSPLEKFSLRLDFLRSNETKQ